MFLNPQIVGQEYEMNRRAGNNFNFQVSAVNQKNLFAVQIRGLPLDLRLPECLALNLKFGH